MHIFSIFTEICVIFTLKKESVKELTADNPSHFYKITSAILIKICVPKLH